MKKFIFQFTALIIIIFGALIFYKGGVSNIPLFPQATRQTILVINDAKLKVEIADTQSKRSKGLGGREALAQDEGMLFIFDREDKYPFWMKGLKFPLDFVWIRGDKVVDVIQNAQAPQPNTADESLPIYLPQEPIDKVLEVNAGTSERLKIKVGDTIRIEK
ncbi:DUF192 domain-containing protein [Candidatus Microgenomates bacterium]|nr:DUF192 domain-containing protein [Candidatus Microgenomates bacterium]